MFIGLLAAMGVASQLRQFHEMFDGSSEPIGILLAAGVMFLVGGIDDIREVSPPAKVAGQVFSGSVLSLFGVTMLYFRVPFASYDYIVLSPDLAALVTVLAVVFLANAMNLIDGLDGLASGIGLIAGLALFLYADRLFKAGLIEGSNIGPLVAIIIVGMCAGFLPHNFNPARIFMGDAGAMLLGLLLAVTTITIGGRTADQFSGQTYFFFAPLVIPVLILAVPLLDTAFSFLRRLLHGQSISAADREHLHHRLMRLGHGPRRSVVILWLWTALLSRDGPDPHLHEPGQRARPAGARRPRAAALHLLSPGLACSPGSGSGHAARGCRRPAGAPPARRVTARRRVNRCVSSVVALAVGNRSASPTREKSDSRDSESAMDLSRVLSDDRSHHRRRPRALFEDRTADAPSAFRRPSDPSSASSSRSGTEIESDVTGFVVDDPGSPSPGVSYLFVGRHSKADKPHDLCDHVAVVRPRTLCQRSTRRSRRTTARRRTGRSRKSEPTPSSSSISSRGSVVYTKRHVVGSLPRTATRVPMTASYRFRRVSTGRMPNRCTQVLRAVADNEWRGYACRVLGSSAARFSVGGLWV